MKNHNLTQVFNYDGDFNVRTYYYQFFNRLPYDIEDNAMYKPEIIDVIKNHYQNDSNYSCYTRTFLSRFKPIPNDRTSSFSKFFAVLTDGAMVVCTRMSKCEIDKDYWNKWGVRFYYNGNGTVADEFWNLVEPFRIQEEEKKDKLFMIVKKHGGFQLEALPIREMSVDVNKHYNDDFLTTHAEVDDFLKNDHSGLVILHGKHGTGKSSYIRHIISSTEKKVIYITGDMAGFITSPEFIPFMIEQKGSLIVLEDCEELLATRGSGRGQVNTGLSNILNISDGLLGDVLKLKLICTFNAPLKDIDKALLRKGRLVARYEFSDLAPEKANTLIAEQNLDVPQQLSPISLANLYNYEKPEFEQVKMAIGF